jgi:hypothetical protein
MELSLYQNYRSSSQPPLFTAVCLLLSPAEPGPAPTGTGCSKQAMSAREQLLENVCPEQATEHFSTDCYEHPSPAPNTHPVVCMCQEERLKIVDRVSQ